MTEEHIPDKQSFFEGCQFVLKAPGSFFWTGEHSVMFGQPAIIQPINLYAWVGVEPVISPGFEMDVITAKLLTFSVKKRLELSDMEAITDWREHKAVTTFLNEWKTKTGSKDFFRIKIWCEIPPSVGLNSSGAISACLALLLHALENKLGIEQINEIINDWRKKDVFQLKEDKTFNDVFRKAWLFDDYFHNFSSSGAGPFSSLVNSEEEKELLLYLTDEKGYGTKHPIKRAKLSYESHLGVLSRINFCGKRIGLPDKFRRSVSTLILYCGKPKATQEVLAELDKWHQMNLERARVQVVELLTKDSLEDLIIADPLKEFLHFEEPNIDAERYPRKVFLQGLGLVSWRMLFNILAGEVNSFLKTVGDNHRFLEFYGVFSDEMDELRRRVRNINEKVEVKLTGAGGGGDLVVFGDWKDMQQLRDDIGKMTKDGVFPYQIHYSSRDSGWLPVRMSVYRKVEGEERISTYYSLDEVLESEFLFSDKLWMGSPDGIPKMIWNGQEIPFSIEESHFVRLLLLAAARRAGAGWLHKESDLKFGRGEQDLSDLRKLFISLKFERVAEGEKKRHFTHLLIKTNPKVKKLVRLSLRSDNIVIDPSITDFRTQHLEEVKKHLGNIHQTLKWENTRDRFFSDSKCLILHSEFVKRAADFLQYKFSQSEEVKSLSSQCIEIICKQLATDDYPRSLDSVVEQLKEFLPPDVISSK